MAKKVSKFFRVGVEGDTCDGRVISAQDIQEMAETFDPRVYGCRINLEHLRGILPDGIFKRYGDVVELKAEKIDDDSALKGKWALFAKITPTDDLIAMNKAAQKVYTSMEIQPNFANTGKCYLVGLAVTDDPASLGTEYLEFCRTAKHNPLNRFKLSPENLISVATPVELEFEDLPETVFTALTEKVKSIFGRKQASDDARLNDVHEAVVDVDLTGDPIVLGNNGAKLIFLGTNSNTAQSHNGDLYVDEIFWIPNFQVLRKVASGMASQSHLRSTYFSTPSTLAHDAYPFWSGELYNRGRASAAERVEIDVSHNALAGGLLCADGQWRQIVTIEDALKGGCTLFDIEQLKRENSADDFKNLFMCEFVDDKASVFPFEELQRCMVDTLEEWEDYAPFAANPFGSRPVWIGYDPSHRGDSAGCVVLAPPVVAGGKFRILERHQWKGMDFATQAESIRKLTEKYNVEYIGIDATGLGVGVFQLVRSFYPAARDIRYTPEMKTAMVLKAKDVIRRGCLEYDVSATDITSSFMAIRKTITSSGRSATYEASRSEEASHADLAWATMHALLNEPLTAGISTPLTSTILEFY